MSERCFYCGAVLLAGSFQRDHFPIPESAGGVATVPACLPCHDMKDRMRFDQWHPELVAEILADWPNIGRSTKLLIAKFLAIHAEVALDRASNNAAHADPRGSGGDAPRQPGDGL